MEVITTESLVMMKEKLAQKNSYVKSRIATKVKRFQRLSCKLKRPNQAQQVRGIKIQPLILGKISYGSLNKGHITMVRNELSKRGVNYDADMGIRALTSLLKENENAMVSNDTKHFLPQAYAEDEWLNR